MSDSSDKEIHFRKRGFSKCCKECPNFKDEKSRKFFDWVNGTNFFSNCGNRKEGETVCFSSAVIANWDGIKKYLDEHGSEVEKFFV